MRVSLYIGAALLAVFANSAYSSTYAPRCEEADSPQELRACAGKQRDASEKLLNRTYQRLLLTTSDYNRDVIANAQRAWLVWRDKEAEACAAADGYTRPGSGFPDEYGLCIVDINYDRIKVLQRYAASLRSGL